MDALPPQVIAPVLESFLDEEPHTGKFRTGLLHQIDDYCIPIGDEYPADSIRQRQSEGKITTYYTCCVESYPNTYTFSPPAEAEWIGWYVARKHLDGYLRWALNSWVESPLRDSRFRTWGAGDTYLLYPDHGHGSLRLHAKLFLP